MKPRTIRDTECSLSMPRAAPALLVSAGAPAPPSAFVPAAPAVVDFRRAVIGGKL
jgi:hypothetical protein